MVEISVIIPTLEDRSEIESVQCLERLEFSDYEVIVRGDEGAAKARNEGIKRATADKLVFLDDDSRPQEGYLARASSVLEEEAAVAGRVVHPRDDLFDRHFTDHYGHGPSAKYVDRFVSCNMALRKEVIETVGPFDENFSWGHEETELAERVRAAYDIRYDPELVVEHPFANSYLGFWRKRYRQETQRPYYWHKQGISTLGQIARTGYGALRPTKYLGESAPHTAAKTGRTIAATLGRLHGIVDGLVHGHDEPPIAGGQFQAIAEREPVTKPRSPDSAASEPGFEESISAPVNTDDGLHRVN